VVDMLYLVEIGGGLFSLFWVVFVVVVLVDVVELFVCDEKVWVCVK